MKFKRLNSDYNRLETELNSNLKLFLDIVNTSNLDKLSAKQKNTIIELSFLRVYIAWENFLHETMVDVLAYKQKSQKVSRVAVRDLSHIESLMAMGDYYPKFNYEKVIQREDLFLKVKIYTQVLSSRKQMFDDMKRMRNMVAHEGRELNVNAFYSSVVTKVASHLVLTQAELQRLPGSFLKSRDKTKTTYYFEFYVNATVAAAKEIVQRFNSIK
jgi:hypothetical protein